MIYTTENIYMMILKAFVGLCYRDSRVIVNSCNLGIKLQIVLVILVIASRLSFR